ncbi:hypothetical protein ACWDKQ_25515 [Saccharopolyspora sp. NPDC000995]
MISKEVAEYFEAGATGLVYAQTAIGSVEDECRSWELLGKLASNHAPSYRLGVQFQ